MSDEKTGMTTIRVGKLMITGGVHSQRVFITNENGESGYYSTEEFTKVVEKFFRENM